MARHNEFGKWGEDVAANYMQEHGFEILARNWRHERKEIDIIAQRAGVLYFVEVKTRHGETWNAEDAITSKKRALMWGAMMAWKLQHPSLMPVRYSAIAVVSQTPDLPPEIRWHEDVWNL
ncbi:MAG: YraN family protein [Bacteroidaceae bacterium]|nr:YraN family protein [Bacteroidaceae bacterium]